MKRKSAIGIRSLLMLTPDHDSQLPHKIMIWSCDGRDEDANWSKHQECSPLNAWGRGIQNIRANFIRILCSPTSHVNASNTNLEQ